MKHLKLFEKFNENELIEKFEQIAKDSVEYFNTDPDIEIDVKFFENLPITEQDMDNHSNLFKKILRKYYLDLESYDEESVAIIKLELWKESDKLTAANIKNGVFEKLKLKDEVDIRDTITRLHKLPKELKEEAVKLVKRYKVDGHSFWGTRAKNGVVTELELHPDLVKKIKEHGWPSGFSMGVDKNGYFVHTHRARSKSYEAPDKIPAKAIKFIDSTG